MADGLDNSYESLWLASQPSGIELRAQRRAHHLDELPTPELPLRGKRRPTSPGVSADVLPDKIDAWEVMRLSYLLRDKGPLLDTITKPGSIDPNVGAFDAYVRGAAKRNKQVGADDEEEKVIQIKKVLAVQHAHDILQNNIRTKYYDARLGGTALRSVIHSLDEHEDFNPTAVNYAGAAVEELGKLLRVVPHLAQRVSGGDTLPRRVEHTGVYAVEHPEILANHRTLLGLTLLEEDKERDFWDERRAITEGIMGSRATAQILADVADTEAIIASMGVPVEAA